MKKLFGIAIFTLFGFTCMQAQNYNTAIGIRGILGGDVGGGLTIKHFLGESPAVEGIVAFRQNGIQVTGLYEEHKDLNDSGGLKWFYGAGGHIGFYDDNDNNPFAEETIIGVDGIIGLDFKFNGAPINLSLDYKPFINLIGGGGYSGDAGNLSARFTF